MLTAVTLQNAFYQRVNSCFVQFSQKHRLLSYTRFAGLSLELHIKIQSVPNRERSRLPIDRPVDECYREITAAYCKRPMEHRRTVYVDTGCGDSEASRRSLQSLMNVLCQGHVRLSICELISATKPFVQFS